MAFLSSYIYYTCILFKEFFKEKKDKEEKKSRKNLCTCMGFNIINIVETIEININLY